MKSWTAQEAQAAVEQYLKDDYGRRYRDIYKNVSSEDFAVFSKDADRRTGPTRSNAKDWWRSLLNTPGLGEAERLALAEPCAQLGCSPDDLFRNLPAGKPPDALLVACRKIKDPSAIDGITNTAGWRDERIQALLFEVKKAIGWDNTTGSARRWWEAFESENQHRIAVVLRLAENLKLRSATITEFFLAYVYSNSDDIQANLHYLDYTHLKKEDERKKREAVDAGKKVPIKLDYKELWPPGPNVSDTTGWSTKQILSKCDQTRNRVDWEYTEGSARKWWDDFESKNVTRPALVLRVLEELARRKGTITELFLAHSNSNTDNIRANLHYLDYTRLKKEEERKKHEAAQAAGK